MPKSRKRKIPKNHVSAFAKLERKYRKMLLEHQKMIEKIEAKAEETQKLASPTLAATQVIVNDNFENDGLRVIDSVTWNKIEI